MGPDLFGELAGIERMLDFHVTRHSVLASNLTNANTPGYSPQDLSFTDTMGQLGPMQATNQRHYGFEGGGDASGSTSVGEVVPAPTVDGNGVQIEQTLAQVTANRLRYEQGLELAKNRMALLRYAATDGSGG